MVLRRRALTGVPLRGIVMALCLALLVTPVSVMAGGEQEGEAVQEAPAEVQDGGQQAPSLAAMVESGELPPLEERLPTSPRVIEPVERIGTYGGTMNSYLIGGGDTAWLIRLVSYDNLFSWTPEFDGVVPNVVESYDVNENASEYTFYLREGMKWSDGVPFTADDIMFWYEDVELNTDLGSGRPWILATGVGDDEQIGTIEKIDDYTLRFSFAHPNPLFLETLATPGGDRLTRYPRHYAEQFHIDYSPDTIEAAMEEEGVETWQDLFNLKISSRARWTNPDLPRLNAWVVTVPYTGDATRVVYERNPYYWKVDPDGNQLPYIDRWEFNIYEDSEVVLLNVLAGEFQYASRHISTAENRPVLFENRESGGYRAIREIPDGSNHTKIAFNLTHPDPVKREIFQNKAFRIGLSHAINRQEISDLLFAGSAEPRQVAPLEESPVYNEQLATQYLEYDVDLANEYLDEAGYSQRNGEGIRLGPDGEPILIRVEVATTQAERVDMMELIQAFWREVGVELEIRAVDRTLMEQRRDSNQYELYVWPAGGGLNPILNPRDFLPTEIASLIAPRWAAWYTTLEEEGVRPEEPPAEVKRQLELYSELQSSPPSGHPALMSEILQISADQFYTIGTVGNPPGYAFAANKLRNVLDPMPGSWQYPTPGPGMPEHWFLEEE